MFLEANEDLIFVSNISVIIFNEKMFYRRNIRLKDILLNI